LNSRLELINKHPFYNKQSFDKSKGGDYETWKLAELEVSNFIPITPHLSAPAYFLLGSDR
jgi:hypothetical protein